MEGALIEAEKLATLGRLAAAVAHEINNPLEIATNLLYLALQSPAGGSIVREQLEQAESAVRQASVIAARTLSFSKRSTARTRVAVGQLVDNVVRLQAVRRHLLKTKIVQQCESSATIICRESEIQQILHNLIGNAFDAMGPEGRLYIRARRSRAWRSSRAGVRITVADTGVGMKSETKDRIFDPFFTTKGHSGNGLGLWVLKEIVDASQGTVALRSSQNPDAHGTVFVIFLPDPDVDAQQVA